MIKSCVTDLLSGLLRKRNCDVDSFAVGRFIVVLCCVVLKAILVLGRQPLKFAMCQDMRCADIRP